jgi:hypothetical protein
MRTSAWVTILGLAGLAVACGDQPTEVVPDREDLAGGGRGTVTLATSTSGDGYSITTDKDDYQPGDRVVLTGAGWSPGDILDIVLTDEPQTHAPHEWPVGIESDGTFTDSTYVVDEGDLNVTFTLVATSRATTQSLSVTFTDGNLSSVALNPASRSIPSSGSAQYSIDVDMAGNGTTCTVTLSVLASPALPASVSVSLPDNVVSATNQDFSRTLTLTASGTTPGSYPFTVQAARGSNCQGSGNVTVGGTLVVFGAPASLAFDQQPSNTPAGNAVTPAVTVQVRDANDNLVANSALPITLAIGSNPGSGTLGGTLTQNAGNGIATFPGLSIDKAGTGYTLTASSGALTGTTSTPFNITAGTIAGVSFTTQPSGGTAGIAFSDQPVVTVQDASGNTVTSGQGNNANITLSILAGTGTAGAALTCTANPHQAVAGVAAFANCRINLVGTNYQLRASSTVAGTTYTATSAAFNVVAADNSAPTVNCTVPSITIWYDTDVQVSCTASDVSGLANAADASFTLSTNVAAGTETANALTNTRNVCDTLNNCVLIGFTFKVDKKSPVVTCGSAGNAWHSADVSIACTATDLGSGLANAGDASFNLLTSVAANTEDANASTGSRTVLDGAGNMATAGPVAGNKIDKKAPTLSCGSADGAWHADDVSIACTAADFGAGLADAADASFNLVTSVAANTESPNASTDSRSVADAVGHSVTAGPITGNKVDKKAPTVTCGTADGDWHGSDATVACTASDGGSGLQDAGDASFDLVTNVAAGTETANASTNSRSVLDDVGNSSTAGPVAGNKVDKKAPAFACAAADGAWHADNVSIHCTASDNGSGIESADASFDLSTSVALDNETANAETDSREVQDKVGNGATAGPIGSNKVDKKAPQFTCEAAPTAWSATDVTRECIAVDGGSGLTPSSDNAFSLHTTVLANTETANAETGSKELADAVGNKRTAGPLGNNKVDKKGPTLSLTCPSAPLLLNQPASASWMASDGGSGVASGFVTGSFSVPTNTVGDHTATAAAGLSHDNVGNASTASAPCGYGVNYGFAGFLTPVDPNPAMNGANSGQAIPLKWTLKDYNGNPVTTLASVNVIAASLTCAQGTTADLIEEYAAGASGLINKGDGSYQFNWKTPTSYAKSCKTLKLDLGDGSPVKIALFEFKK